MGDSATTIDAAYASAIQQLTPTEKVARGLAMLGWTRRWIGRQLVAEQGPMPPQRLKLEIARRLYQNEPATCRLIDLALAELGADVPA
jgi:hypothetical protein